MKNILFSLLAVAVLACSCKRTAEAYVHELPEVVIVSYGARGVEALSPEAAGRVVVAPKIDQDAVGRYDKLSVKPQFKDGDVDTFSREYNRRAIYPAAAISSGHAGTSKVSFVIGEDGSVSEVLNIQSSWEEFDSALFNFIKSSTGWKPAEKDGKPLKTTMIMTATYCIR